MISKQYQGVYQIYKSPDLSKFLLNSLTFQGQVNVQIVKGIQDFLFGRHAEVVLYICT